MRGHSRPQTEITKLKIKKTMAGVRHDEQRVINMSIAKKNKRKKWYTNGEYTSLFSEETAPAGWACGRKIK